MHQLMDDIKFILKDLAEPNFNFALGLFAEKLPEVNRTRPFIELSGSEFFMNRLFQLFFTSDMPEAFKTRIVEIMALFGTYTSLHSLFKIYNFTDDRFKEVIRGRLLKYSFRYVDEYYKLLETFAGMPRLRAFILELVDRSGYFERLIGLLEYPSEKVALYVLKQFYRTPDERLLPVISELRADQNWMVRFNALQVLKRINSDDSRALILEFLADENLKVRDEAKMIVVRNFDMYSRKVFEQIEYPETVNNYAYLDSLIDIYGQKADLSKISKILKIVVGFPEIVSVKARTLLLKVLKLNFERTGRMAEPGSQSYVVMEEIISGLLSWKSDQFVQFLNQIFDLCGLYYFEIMAKAYLGSEAGEVRQAVRSYYRANPKLHEKEFWISFCNSTDREPKENFVKFLFAENDRKAVAGLTKILDSGSLARPKAVELLKILSASGVDMTESLTKYRKNISSMIKETRMEAVELLASLKDRVLLAYFAKHWPEIPNEQKTHAVGIIGECFVEPTNFKIICSLYSAEPDPGIKASILALLGKIENIESTELLIRSMSAADRVVRETAARILLEKGKKRYLDQMHALPEDIKDQLGAIVVNYDRTFLAEIEKELASPDSAIRSKVMKILLALIKGKNEKVLELLRKFSRDPDARIRADFTRALGLVGGPMVADMLTVLLNDENDRVRANAVEIIGMLDFRGVTNLLMPLVSHANNRVRANAIIALYKMGFPNAIVALSEMLHSTDKWMRASAAYALGEINDKKTLPLLYKMLNDEDENVVLNVIRVLRKIGEPDTIKLLIGFANNENAAIKTEAAQAIDVLKKRRSDSLKI